MLLLPLSRLESGKTGPAFAGKVFSSLFSLRSTWQHIAGKIENSEQYAKGRIVTELLRNQMLLYELCSEYSVVVLKTLLCTVVILFFLDHVHRVNVV